MVKKWWAFENKFSENALAFSMKKMLMWVNSNVKNSSNLKTAWKLQFKNKLMGKWFNFILNYYFDQNYKFQSDLNIISSSDLEFGWVRE
jgi:hypothetical protein